MADLRERPTSLEAVVKKRARRGALEHALLGTLALAGLLTVAATVPKLLSLVRDEHLELVLPQDPRQRLHETARRLKHKGLIVFEKKNGRIHMRITEKGKRELAKLRIGAYRIKKPRRWDGRWRIVIFDVRESRRADRARIRRLLLGLHFIRLQDSVWVSPFDCEEVVALIKQEYRLGPSLLYIVAAAIEFDRKLREDFDLPLS